MAENKYNEACVCGNNDPQKIKQYHYEDQFLGTCCLNCNREWLLEEFVSKEKDSQLDRTFNKHKLRKRKTENPKSLSDNASSMVNTSREKIDLLNFVGDYVKPGDHIAWERPYVIWHHAIVVKHDTENEKLRIIHWHKDDKKGLLIVEESIDLTKEKGTLYRLDYPIETEKVNPQRLVLARARSRVGESGYEFFGDNCEAFATYCKLGVNHSSQVAWFRGRILAYINTYLASITKPGFSATKHLIVDAAEVSGKQIAKTVACAEIAEKMFRASNAVGAGFVIMIEGGMCIYDITKLSKKRAEGMSRVEYIKEVIKRVVEGLTTAGLAIGASFFGEALGGAIGTALMPGVGTAIGMFIGSIIGGAIGGITGKAGGSALAPFIARALTSTIKRTDFPVEKLSDLEEGDQVVLWGNLLHPRHHVIFVKVDKNDPKKAQVIHNTYSKGIVEETIDLVKPIYRISYHESQCRPATEVIERARSKVGEYRYNIATYNCKTFANWCKAKDTK